MKRHSQTVRPSEHEKKKTSNTLLATESEIALLEKSFPPGRFAAGRIVGAAPESSAPSAITVKGGKVLPLLR